MPATGGMGDGALGECGNVCRSKDVPECTHERVYKSFDDCRLPLFRFWGVTAAHYEGSHTVEARHAHRSAQPLYTKFLLFFQCVEGLFHTNAEQVFGIHVHGLVGVHHVAVRPVFFHWQT